MISELMGSNKMEQKKYKQSEEEEHKIENRNDKGRFIKNHKTNIGRKCLDETKQKISKKNTIKTKEYLDNHPEYLREKIKQLSSPESREKMKQTLKRRYQNGMRPWNYIDGLALKRERLRTDQVHKIWCSQSNLNYVPKGFVIHHLDFNPMNNKFENLQLLSKKAHNTIHNELIKINRGIKND